MPKSSEVRTSECLKRSLFWQAHVTLKKNSPTALRRLLAEGSMISHTVSGLESCAALLSCAARFRW